MRGSILVCALVVLLLGINPSLKAEGTAQAMPNPANGVALLIYATNSSGNYLNAPTENRVFFHVKDHTTENLYFGLHPRKVSPNGLSTNSYYRILDPSGTVVAGPTLLPNSANPGFIADYATASAGPNINGLNASGYDPILFDPTSNGEYYIELYNSTNGGVSIQGGAGGLLFCPFFDFTVATATNTVFPGRVHSQKWSFVTYNPLSGSKAFDITKSFEGDYFAYTADSSVTNVDFQTGFKPLGYVMSMNNYGGANTGNWAVDRISAHTGTSTPAFLGGYPIFLQNPDPTVYIRSAAASAPVIAFTVTGCPGAYTIPFSIDKPGDVTILLDLNGSPGYQAGTEDVTFDLLGLAAGAHTLPWNGLNGLGATVSGGTNVDISATLFRGRTNVPIFDAEVNTNGLTVSGVSPAASNRKMYWDDTQISTPPANISCPVGASATVQNTNNSTGAGVAETNTFGGYLGPNHGWDGSGPGFTVPAAQNGIGSATTLACDDFGNARTINTWFWAFDISSGTVSRTLPICNTAPVAVNDTTTIPQGSSGVDVGVLGNDTDVDLPNDSLITQPTIVTGPTNGSASVNANGTVNYVPNLAFSGLDSLQYAVCDTAGPACDTAWVFINVTPAGPNNPPVAVNDTTTTAEETLVNVTVLGNDTDADLPNDSLITQPTIVTGATNGTATVNANGTIDYTPNANFSGLDSLQYAVCDTAGPACDTAWVFINVTPVNDPPVAVNDTTTTAEDSPINVVVLGNDTDADLPNDSLITQPTIVTGATNGTATVNANGTIDYTPNANFSGLDSLQYTVCDTAGPACDTAWVFINVTPVNDPPVAVNDTTTTPENTLVNVLVQGNDTDVDFPNDSLITQPTIVTGATNGTATVNANGTIDYTPNANFSGLDSLQYAVCDTAGPACDTAWVFINVTPVNDPPVAVNDTTTTGEDSPVNVAVLGNDTDADFPNDSLITQPTIVTGATNGTATVNANGTVDYTPNANFSGLDSLQYAVCDTAGPACDTAWIFINVTPVNDPPVAVNDTTTTGEDSPVNVAVLGNDTDADFPNDSLITQPTIVTGATNGTATVNANGTIDYTPNANFSGLDSLQYAVCDTAGPACDTAWVFITVTPVNDPPVAVNDTTTTPENTLVNVLVQGNDTDVDFPNDSLITQPTIVTGAANGSATVNANGTIDYTPNNNFNGLDSLQYAICDTAGPACDTAWVFINVTSVNSPPVAVNDTTTTAEDSPVNIVVLGNDTDADLPNDSLITQPTIVTGATNGIATVNANGTIDYTPNANFSGLDSLQYAVCDTAGPACDTAWVFITVTPVNDPPVAVNDTTTTPENTLVNVLVQGNDTDVDFPNDSLITQPTIVTGAANGSATVNANGTIDYTPNNNFNGLDSLQYAICDTAGPACDTAWVFINVTSVNSAPVAVNDTTTTAEDSPVNVVVLGNDTDADLPNDSLITQPTIVTGATNGTATVNANGTVDYTPNANFSGLDSLQYAVCDTAGPACDTAWIYINVTPVNDPPVAINDTTSTGEDTPVNVVVLVNDTDADHPNDSLITQPTIVTGATNGTATVNANGTVDYTPNANFSGLDSLQYAVCDTAGPACDTAWVFINVTPVNDPPVAINDTTSTGEDTPVNVVVLVNDTDADLPNDSLITQPTIVTGATNGTATVNANGTVDYTPNANFSGLDSLQYAVCDTAGPACDTAWVFITVTPVNDPPVAVNDTTTTPENTLVNVLVQGNDTDVDFPNDSLITQPTIVTGAANGSATVNANGTIDYTPNNNFNGLDSLQYAICDTAGPACDTAWVFINVTSVNSPPVAVNDTTTTAEDSPVNIVVLGNDTDADLPNDSLITQPTIVTGATNGTATVNANGTVDYTPNANFSGLDSLQYAVCDTAGPACDTAWVFITVTPVNDPPVAVNDTVTIAEDSSGVDVIVLGNDTDVDLPNDSLITQGVLVTGPTNGTATVNPNGTVNYVPNGNFSGLDSLQYAVCDTAGPACDTAWIYINVTPVNDPPVAINDTTSTGEDTPVNVVVLVNDTDTDLPNDSLITQPTIVTGATNGTATVNANGTVDYTPNANFSGLDSLQYAVCDTAGPACDTAWVFITVTPVNDPPVAVNDTVTIAEDSSGVDVIVLGNDTDVDLPNDSLITQGVLVTGPTNGTATVNPNGTVNYVPNGNFSGLDSLQYAVCDTAGPACDTAWIYINVTPVNDPPVAINDTTSTGEDTPVNVVVLVNDTDADLPNDSLITQPTIVTGATNGTATVNANGTVDYTPNANFSGLDSLQYAVCDTAGPACDTAWVFITVTPVNDPPVAVNDTVTIAEDSSGVDVIVIGNDTDVDLPNDSLITQGVLVTGPTNGTATVNPNGTVNYVPNGNFSGLDSLQYAVCDTAGPACDTAWVFINVTPVNDPPVAINDTTSTGEDTPVNVVVLVNDTDADLPNDSLITQPTIVTGATNGTATVNANGTVDYTPNANFSGLDSLQYAVCDTAGPACDTAWVFINVTPVNDPPVAVNDTVTIAEDSSGVDVIVLGNDTDVDLPNDSLITQGVLVTGPTNGTATVNPNGTVNYVPNGNFSGLDSLQYAVCDTAGPACDTAWVFINVTPVNDPPVAINDTTSTGEDTPVNVVVLVNDTDADLPNDSLITQPTIVTGATNGTATVNANGTVDYTPNANFSGLDSLQYAVCDTAGPACDTAWVFINVTPVNDPPVAINDTVTIAEDSSGVDVIVLGNDSDVDLPNDSLITQGVLVTGPTNGTATVNPNGTVNYVPNGNFSGLDSLQYAVCDTAGPACDTAWVYINVTPVNDPPVAINDTTSTGEDTPVNVVVLVNDTDADLPNDSLITQPTIVTGATNGTATVNANGTVDYTPNANFSGLDSLQYAVCDTAGPACDTAWVFINVTPVNDPPVAINDTTSTGEDTPVNVVVLVNDTDADLPNDSLITQPTIVTGATNGTATVNANGTVDYTPNANFSGLDSLQYAVCDTAGPACDTAWVFINVTPVNDPPVAINDTTSTGEDTPVNVVVLVNDTDADLPNDSLITQPTIVTGATNGTATVNANGTVDYTPNANFSGLDSLQYAVCDTAGPACDTAWVFITVTPVNDPPVAVNDTVTIAEDSSGVDVIVLGNDSDVDLPNDSLITQGVLVTGPTNGTATVNPNGTVNYVPNGNFSGLDSLQYAVCDTAGPACDTAWIYINVTPVNDPPVAINDTTSTGEDTPVNVVVLVNDTDADLPNDSLITQPTIVTGATNGTATVNANGTVDYTPNANFSGLDSLQYAVCDTAGPACDTAWVFITVTPVNDPPVAVNDTVTIAEDSSGVDVIVLGNDTDVDLPNDSLITQGVLVTGPTNGTATVNPNGTVNYVPNGNFSGLDSLQYAVCDTAGPACDTAWVYINVTPVNDPPVAINDTTSTGEDTPVNVVVLVNDTDADLPNDSLITQPTIVTGATNGTATVNANGTVDYTPNANFSGLDSLQYAVCDTAGPACDTAWVFITVTPVNDPPVAVNDTVTIAEDSSGVDVIVLGNDSDVDLPNDSLITQGVLVTGPTNGTATVNPNGTVNYVPNGNFSGLDSLQYAVCDTAGPACDTAWIYINVTPVNDPPVAINDTITIIEDSPGSNISVLLNDTDPDLPNDSIVTNSISVMAMNGSAGVNLNGTINYVPNPNFSGVDSLQYIVCDTTGPLCDTAWVLIYVTPVNDPPVAGNDTTATNEDTPVTVNPLGNDFDVDGGIDSTSVTISTLPTNGTATVGPSGVITYTPAPHFCGQDSLEYTVCDSGLPLPVLCTTAWMYIDVACVNDGPVAVDDSSSVPNDQPGGVNIDVLANDTDPDGDSLMVTSIPCAALNGLATINANGTVNYVPNPGFVGIDTFCYVVCDTSNPQGCDTAYVFVNVLGSNNPPVAGDDSTSTPVGTLVVIDVQTNDSDPDGDSLTTTILCDPSNGLAWVADQDSIIYVPQAGFTGYDTLCYVVCDGNTPPLCDTAYVVIWVYSDNNPPVASNDSITIGTGMTGVIDPLFNDSDPDGDSIVFSGIITPPTGGTATVNPDGTISYTPMGGFSGLDSLQYILCDNGVPVLCDTAWIYITVSPEDNVMIPTGFSPNGDGDNDAFEIVGLDNYANNELIVFNRWGNVVFQREGYLNDWKGIWDKNDEPLPEGTYFYVLDLKDGEKPRSGYIVLFR